MSDTVDIRRLAAILAADVAGYSRLMQQDDRGTVDMLDRSRQVFRLLIQAGQGRIVDMAGDSVMAVFETATGAVQVSLEIQKQLAERNASIPEARRMQFRIGIHLGEVIVKPDGTVYGDGVNIAARLQSIAEPGGLCISSDVHNQVRKRIDAQFESIGDQRVKNIAEAIAAYRWLSDSPPKGTSPLTAAKSAKKKIAVAGTLLTAAVLAVAAYYYFKSHSGSSRGAPLQASAALSLPDKPSIAVLPFVNMSEDAKQDYFSDGMTEDVITSLSKLSGLFVISRNSVFTYKGRAVKPEQVSRELGVRYVLEGSVRKADKQVRITAQLIDGTNGYHVWAEHYDGELKDIFKLQDGVTQRIVSALSPKLAPNEGSANAHPETSSVEAYDLYQRAKNLQMGVMRENVPTVRRMFEQAIALDPQYARAYAGLAWTYYDEYNQQWSPDPENLTRAVDIARKAVAADPAVAEAHRTLGFLLMFQKQHDAGLAELERAVALDPNFSWAYAMLAYGLIYNGKPEEAIGFVSKALRLDPRCEAWVATPLGESYFWLRRYDEAIAALQDVVRRNPKYPSAHRILAAAYAEMGREKEARAEVEELLRLNPKFKLDVYRARAPYKNEVDRDRVIGALQRAGLK